MEKRLFTVRYGLYSFAGIAVLFLLMKLLGLENIPYLRTLNLVIVVLASNNLARRNLKANPDLDYFSALISLFLANMLTVVLSVIGFVFYAGVLDPEFLEHFKGGVLWSGHITLPQAVLALFIEGMAGSVAVSFMLMQYWKDAKPVRNVDQQKAS